MMRELLLTLFDKPAAWTQGALARNAKGEPVTLKSTEATCWCLVAGVRICAGDFESGNVNIIKLGNKAKELFGTVTLTDFNNEPGRKFEEVTALIKATYTPAA